MGEILSSEKVILSAPTSFIGSAKRIWRITESDSSLIKLFLFIPLALILISFTWLFVAIWYVIIFGLFGIFVIPYRLWTRGSRKNRQNRLRHRELLRAIEKKKM